MKGAPLLAMAAVLAQGAGPSGVDSPVPVPGGNVRPDFSTRISWKGKFHGVNQRQRRKRARQVGHR
jgi:hypothetical protein